MTVLSATHPSLAERLWPEAGTLRIAGLLLAGSALLALSARVQIPFWPVPITMQTFAVLVIGMAYGRNLALGAVLVYLGEGAIGLPVFASGAGVAYFAAAPSAGYLIGFVPAAALVGLLAERGWDRSVPATLAAMVLGTAVIFLFGVLGLIRYMTAVDGLDAATAMRTALVSGVLPYLPGAMLKIALAAMLLPAIWRVLGRR